MTAMHPTSRALWCVLALTWLGAAHAQIGPIEDLDAFPSANLEIKEGKRSDKKIKVTPIAYRQLCQIAASGAKESRE